MIKLALIGNPLNHSLSPVMHNAALQYLGIKGEYTAIETPPDQLISRIKYLKVEGYTGFNVTIPLKVWIVPLLNEVDEYANVAGAINTVLISDDKKLFGFNTDIDGFIESIPEVLRENLISKSAVVIGTGGAARAVGIGLAIIGVKDITFYARKPEKETKLKEIITKHFRNVNVTLKELNEFADLRYASIIINATPLGTTGEYEDISPVNKVSIANLRKDTIIYDMVYNPRKTKLIKYAMDNDLYTINGLEMLVLQGAKSLSLWIDQEAPVDVMREAVLKSLPGE